MPQQVLSGQPYLKLITAYYPEARYRPWWVSCTAADTKRIARHKEQRMISAPASWVLVVGFDISLPFFLGI
jgi:hypothetical protein